MSGRFPPESPTGSMVIRYRYTPEIPLTLKGPTVLGSILLNVFFLLVTSCPGEKWKNIVGGTKSFSLCFV